MYETAPTGDTSAPGCGSAAMIRRATPADVPAMARIVTEWLRTVPWNLSAPSPETLRRTIADALTSREIWVEDEPVAGYLSLDPNAAHIHGFYVATPGHGAGRRLLDHVKAGRNRLTLNTHMPNRAAQRFYAREGFVMIENDIPGDDGPDEMRMEWRR